MQLIYTGQCGIDPRSKILRIDGMKRNASAKADTIQCQNCETSTMKLVSIVPAIFLGGSYRIYRCDSCGGTEEKNCLPQQT